MVWRLEVSEPASDDVEKIYEYIARHSRRNAGRWYRGLLDKIASLAHHPDRCPLVRLRADFGGQDVRELLYGTRRSAVRIQFTISGDSVIVLHVYHAARRIRGE